jgi:hypothetical protein
MGCCPPLGVLCERFIDAISNTCFCDCSNKNIIIIGDLTHIPDEIARVVAEAETPLSALATTFLRSAKKKEEPHLRDEEVPLRQARLRKKEDLQTLSRGFRPAILGLYQRALKEHVTEKGVPLDDAFDRFRSAFDFSGVDIEEKFKDFIPVTRLECDAMLHNRGFIERYSSAAMHLWEILVTREVRDLDGLLALKEVQAIQEKQYHILKLTIDKNVERFFEIIYRAKKFSELPNEIKFSFLRAASFFPSSYFEMPRLNHNTWYTTIDELARKAAFCTPKVEPRLLMTEDGERSPLKSLSSFRGLDKDAYRAIQIELEARIFSHDQLRRIAVDLSGFDESKGAEISKLEKKIGLKRLKVLFFINNCEIDRIPKSLTFEQYESLSSVKNKLIERTAAIFYLFATLKKTIDPLILKNEGGLSDISITELKSEIGNYPEFLEEIKSARKLTHLSTVSIALLYKVASTFDKNVIKTLNTIYDLDCWSSKKALQDFLTKKTRASSHDDTDVSGSEELVDHALVMLAMRKSESLEPLRDYDGLAPKKRVLDHLAEGEHSDESPRGSDSSTAAAESDEKVGE